LFEVARQEKEKSEAQIYRKHRERLEKHMAEVTQRIDEERKLFEETKMKFQALSERLSQIGL
jgi:hypothetical protein